MSTAMITRTTVFAAGLLLLANAAVAADLFVDPAGDDSNLGSKEAPLATLDGARRAIASRGLAGKESVTVHVADGVYYLPETLADRRWYTPSDQGYEQQVAAWLAFLRDTDKPD